MSVQNRKLLASIPLGLLITLPATAQTEEELVRLIAQRNEKLRSPFLRQAEWLTDYDKAKARAAETGKPVLIYFTRSYAESKACAAVEVGLFSSTEFKNLAERVVLFCHVTSKVATDPRQDLLKEMGGEGVPLVVFADSVGRRLATVARLGSLADIAAVLDGEVAAFTQLRDRAAKGDKAAKAEFFMKRLELGHLSPAEIQVELETANYLTKPQRDQIQASLASLEVMEILARIDEKNPKTFEWASKQMLVMMRKGRVPSGSLAFPFWQILLAHADKSEDADLFATSLQSIKKVPGAGRDQKWIERMELRLRALQFMQQRKKGGK